MDGLSSEQAQQLLLKFGPNQIFKKTEISFFSIVREEITEPIILLLFGVGVLYSLWGKLEDTITIFFVVTALVLTEVFNEYRAKKAINSLEKIAAPKTRVLRDGKITEIETENIVPGDILILYPGLKIGADATLAKAINIQIDESALTGESFPVSKSEKNEIFAGTVVVAGEGQAVVVKTGPSTKFGQIAASLKTINPPRTKLQLAMKALAGKLLYIAIAVSILIPVIGVLRGQDFKIMILTGLALSFAVIPEELPMVITMVLGLGSYTLSKKNFLVKKIKAAETMGNVTVIVTDKTGTITEGLMKPVNFFPLTDKEILNNVISSISPLSPSPLDQSLIKMATEMNIKSNREIINLRDMDNEKKTIATITKDGENYELTVRGAPEEIFSLCKKIDEKIKTELSTQTNQGKRVIALASKKLTASDIKLNFEKLENNLDFAGLIGFEDSPRPNIKETINQVYTAGIRTIMVTGDHPETAVFVASEVGIKSEGKVLTGEDLKGMSDEKLQEAVTTVSIFARATPQDKYRIVHALQSLGEVVAVTGDGINDALALKTADVGIAMGIRGTDVAKEAAEIVLADDNYITIATGIFEGRKLFDNLQKGIKYYLSVKFALVLIFLLPVILGVPTPFAPIQIIVLEMFMDLAASAGYVAEPMEKDVYSPFRNKTKEGVLGSRSVRDIILRGFILFLTVVSVYFYARSQNMSLVASQTFAFASWIFAHIFLAFISRSDRQSLWNIGFFTNKIIDLWALGAIGLLLAGVYWPLLNARFSLTPISIASLIEIAVFSYLMANIIEVTKFIERRGK